MILLTTAANDQDIAPLFNPSLVGPNIAQYGSEVYYGDFVFWGYAYRKAVKVSGDRKTLTDLIACIQNGRHLFQIQRARAAGFDIIFLVCEFEIRQTSKGQIEILEPDGSFRLYDRDFSHNRIFSYLAEIALLCGVQVFWSGSPQHTVDIVEGLHNLLQRPKHGSLETMWTPSNPYFDFMTEPPSLVRKIAAQFQGVGFELSEVLAARYQTPYNLIMASPKDHQQLPGIGPKIAKSIYESARTRE